MHNKDKRELLAYFTNKSNKQRLVVCEITGIAFQIQEPFLPPLRGMIWQGLSPLASIDAALQLGKYSYSEAHYNLEPSTLAGAILSLLSAFNLRHDKLSAVEANMILSQNSLYDLSSALRFLARLSTHERRRIPSISFNEAEPASIKTWLWAAKRAIDVTDFEPTYKEPKLQTGKGILDQSILVETRKEARSLLQSLKADSILPLKLQTIIQMSIQKNNLAMISEELRNNIIKGLESLATPDCFSLAAIFRTTAKNLTVQESITKRQFEEGFESASDSFTGTNVPSLKLSLKEILEQRKNMTSKEKKSQKQIASELLDMIPSIESEVEAEQMHPSDCECGECYTEEELATMQEDQSIDEEFLEDHDSLEAIQKEAQIEELFVKQLEFSDATQDDLPNLDVDSLFNEEEQS